MNDEPWEAPELAKRRRHHRIMAGWMGTAIFAQGLLIGMYGLAALCLVAPWVALTFWMLVEDAADACTDSAFDQHEHEYDKEQKRQGWR